MRVPVDLDGERADKVVAVLAGVSRATARQMVDSGEVRCDGEVVRGRDRVPAGSDVEFPAPEERPALEPEPVEFTVVHADEAVLVVDKPAGLVVHPGAGRRRGTLAAGLLERFPDLEGVGQPDRWGIVHRLDRDTSGLMVVARTADAYDALTGDLRRRRVTRTYLALTVGSFALPTGTIDAPLIRDPSDPRKRKAAPGGRPARTHYRVLSWWPDADASLLEVRLETGRTHQIRVHMAAIDHPVVGDPWYGRPSRVESPRVFLHAARLGFTHPVTGEWVEFEASLHDDLQTVLDALGPDGGTGEVRNGVSP